MATNIVISREDLIQKVDEFIRSTVPCRFWIFSKIYIPRVRLSVKDLDQCLVVIYTGVEKFIRMEFLKKSGAVLVKSSENTYDPDSITIQKVKSTSPIQLACQILKATLVEKSTLIGTLEIEFSEKELKPQVRIAEEILKTVDARKDRKVFRTKRIITSYLILAQVSTTFYRFLIDGSVLKEASVEGVYLDSGSLTPGKLVESVTDCHGRILGVTDVHMAGRDTLDRESLIIKAAHGDRCATCRLADPINFHIWDLEKTPSTRVNRKVEMKRIEAPHLNMVCRFNRSKCGVWIHLMKMENEQKWLKVFENETCGLRWLCKNCSDPFDYWFYRNLPRRLHEEPEWIDSVYRTTGKQEFLKTFKGLKRKFQQQDNQGKPENGQYSKIFYFVFWICVPILLAILVLCLFASVLRK